MNNLDHALEYAEKLGWYVFPCWWVENGACACGKADCESKGKHPLGAAVPRGVLEATTDPKLIRHWWKRYPEANVAVHCGPSGFIAIDLDSYKEIYEPEAVDKLLSDVDLDTVTNLTPSPGQHLLYKNSVRYGNNRKLFPPGIDIRSWGAYIMLPPSNHVKPRLYEWEADNSPFDREMREIPDKVKALLDEMERRATEGRAKAAERAFDVAPELEKVAEALTFIPNWSAKDKAGGLSYDEWLAVLMAVHSSHPNEEGIAVCEAWSPGANGEIAAKWASFKSGGGITIGTLAKMAKDHGWKGNLDAEWREGFSPVHMSIDTDTGVVTEAAPAKMELAELLEALGDIAKKARSTDKPPSADTIKAWVEPLLKHVGALNEYPVLIADAMTNTGGWGFSDALQEVQTRILAEHVGRERAIGEAAKLTKINTLRNMGRHFRLNLMEDNPEMDGKPVDDVTRSEIYLYMAGHKVPQATVDHCINALAKEDAYHPIKDYLNGLVWDGKDHLLEMLNHIIGDGRFIDYRKGRLVRIGDTDDSNATVSLEDMGRTGAYAPLHWVIIRRWLLGVVSRALEGDKQTAFKHQTPVLVFVGGQGIGKSSWVRWLVSGVGFDYHRESGLEPTNNEHIRSAVTKWIWEVGEIGSSLRKTDRDQMKSFLTQEWHTYRKPWGRGQITKPTLCNFVGTSNTETGFLDDPTGHRRYLPLSITHVDHGYKDAVEIDQLWAQIVHLFRNGESPELSTTERRAMGETLEDYEVENPLQGHVQRLFRVDPADELNYTFTSDIIHALKLDGIALNPNPKWAGREINEALIPLGVKREKRSIDGVKGWGWLGVRARSKI